ncbi:membrane cofactor protein isoform X2 [Choloepus didactylus]|uniref:membrane cofactor protein isoform X2 n=1 Tax=Choloepus didactylus TaxID=27675 RepID=UPI00189F4A38|nr:membrane cofactor protein isoform X2 [Choloepus didactylus]XP_037680752.1 membrane cofactor protein isoform X2 [Choloepus didactylus]
MMASFLPQRAFRRRRESSLPSWYSFGPLLLALVLLLLSADCDSCGAPPRFTTMMMVNVSADSYAPGAKIVYTCHLGYSHNTGSPLFTVCQDDNTWTPLQEACRKKSCRPPAEPLNGRVNMLNGTLEFGSQVEYVCDEGFRLIGTKILYCDISGSTVAWSDDPPLCEVILCLPPATIENGQYSNGKDIYQYGEVVIYSCKIVSGADKLSLIGNSQLVCSNNGEWSSDPPQCKVVRCSYPIVSNGKQTSGFGTTYHYKARVTFECDKNFVLQGSSTVTCGANATWQPPLPTCVPVSTPPLSTPSSTKTPIPSRPGSVPPSHKPPVSTPPGFVPPSVEPPSSKPLGADLIAVIVITTIVGVTIIVTVVYIFLRRQKRGTYLTDENHREVKFIYLGEESR